MLNLKVLKKLKFLLIISIVLFSCNKKDSTTSVSSSDNTTFENRKYTKQEPIRPFGNLPTLRQKEPKSEQHYYNYVDNKYAILSENDEYFKWLAEQRRKRIEAGRRNGNKSETMPSYNDYYINKSRNIEKGNNVPVNERRLKDIERKLEETKIKIIEEEKIETIDEIDDYEILSPMPDNEWNLKVNAYDYND